MKNSFRKAESLAIGDLEASPVWEFVNDDGIGETVVRPIKRIPVRDLDGKLVGTQVRLANGNMVWALIGNVDAHNARITEQFLTLSVCRNGKWFDLARYHDHDYSKRGPRELSKFLNLKINEVFPISYDLSKLAKGNSRALIGKILGGPREKLTRAELIALAVP